MDFEDIDELEKYLETIQLENDNVAKVLPWNIDIDVFLDDWKLLQLGKDDSSDVYYQRFFDLGNPSGQLRYPMVARTVAALLTLSHENADSE
ncbi:hypothetical protein FQA39_LY06651 [Lamprigera yunnana]|nr:hypothetical protein FQA39_LY06651 [Lamprigera yunnana]